MSHSLSLISGMCIVEGQNWLLQVSSRLYTCNMKSTCTQHANKCNLNSPTCLLSAGISVCVIMPGGVDYFSEKRNPSGRVLAWHS